MVLLDLETVQVNVFFPTLENDEFYFSYIYHQSQEEEKQKTFLWPRLLRNTVMVRKGNLKKIRQPHLVKLSKDRSANFIFFLGCIR